MEDGRVVFSRLDDARAEVAVVACVEREVRGEVIRIPIFGESVTADEARAAAEVVRLLAGLLTDRSQASAARTLAAVGGFIAAEPTGGGDAQ